MACKPYNKSADVYSFATVVWETMAWKKPFENYTPTVFLRAIADGVRPEIKKKWPDGLKQLLSECWQADMVERPDFRELVPRLESLLEDQVWAELPKKVRAASSRPSSRAGSGSAPTSPMARSGTAKLGALPVRMDVPEG